MIQDDVVKFLFLSEFHQPPFVVDEMDAEQVDNMIVLSQLIKEKEHKMMEEAKSRAR